MWINAGDAMSFIINELQRLPAQYVKSFLYY